MPAASVFVCQGGCGTFEPDAAKMQARGIVNEKLYCEKCIVQVDDYLSARDNLHTRLAVEWADGLAGLRRDWEKVVKALPDA
jgi:hypothetical protein